MAVKQKARPVTTRHGLARILSKRGICSRTEAARWIVDGRVCVGGRIVRDPESATAETAVIALDGVPLDKTERVYIALNKPRGLVTTVVDERGRDTVYRCFDGAGLPWLAPVGRLDKASEGLLLFCNDPEWAARVSDPTHGQDKTYHVQVDSIPDAELLAALVRGIEIDGAFLRAKSARLLRAGGRNAWMEIVLDEGRNRQIRRLLGALDMNVLRLIRVAIGTLVLGDLQKGQWRPLADDEVRVLTTSNA
jgi:23S rRNA pseudouridine2605 synthase